MRLMWTAAAMFPVTVALLLSSSTLPGQGLIDPPPPPVYVPHHAPLPYLTFRPLHSFHGGHAYQPYAFGYVPHYPQAPFFFGYPLIRERIIILKHALVLSTHYRSIPKINFWLLALKGGPIYAVTDYWLEEDTLHYVERNGTKASVPLIDVDLGFTKRLNRKLGMPFRLPQSRDGNVGR